MNALSTYTTADDSERISEWLSECNYIWKIVALVNLSTDGHSYRILWPCISAQVTEDYDGEKETTTVSEHFVAWRWMLQGCCVFFLRKNVVKWSGLSRCFTATFESLVSN